VNKKNSGHLRSLSSVFSAVALSLILAACGEQTVIRSYYPNGSVNTEAITKDSVLNGRSVLMNEAGVKVSEAEYKGGALSGKSISYFPDGKPKASAEFEGGALNGQSVSYYPNGQKATEATFKGGVLVGAARNWTEAGAEK
jgi:uncharacterized protein